MSKMPFTTKELNEFKSLLLEKKAQILKEIQGKESELTAENDEVGDLADMASGLIERELNMSLSEADRGRLDEIDSALTRIKNKTYGICVDSGEVINKVRLKAVPEASRTIAAQEAFDKQMRKKKIITRATEIE